MLVAGSCSPSTHLQRCLGLVGRHWECRMGRKDNAYVLFVCSRYLQCGALRNQVECEWWLKIGLRSVGGTQNSVCGSLPPPTPRHLPHPPHRCTPPTSFLALLRAREALRAFCSTRRAISFFCISWLPLGHSNHVCPKEPQKLHCMVLRSCSLLYFHVGEF